MTNLFEGVARKKDNLNAAESEAGDSNGMNKEQKIESKMLLTTTTYGGGGDEEPDPHLGEC
jgi:hypothetical protein